MSSTCLAHQAMVVIFEFGQTQELWARPYLSAAKEGCGWAAWYFFFRRQLFRCMFSLFCWSSTWIALLSVSRLGYDFSRQFDGSLSSMFATVTSLFHALQFSFRAILEHPSQLKGKSGMSGPMPSFPMQLTLLVLPRKYCAGWRSLIIINLF